MKWTLDISFERPQHLIHHKDPILLMGSCFTNNIGAALSNLYFNVLANPGGVLFDTPSICRIINRALDEDWVKETELIYLNDLYQNLDFHSDCSSPIASEAVKKMNAGLMSIREFLPTARHLILTLGSAFSYRHLETNALVSNCHRIPAPAFKKELLASSEIQGYLNDLITRLNRLFPELHIMITVSPVRHIRDGVIANNRSKARLLEAVHSVVDENSSVYYFPAYDYVIDVLRDYRWFDTDLVHPNYAATEAVFERFCETCMDAFTLKQFDKLNQIRLGMNHKPRFPETKAHQDFLANLEEKKKAIQNEMPWIQLA